MNNIFLAISMALLLFSCAQEQLDVAPVSTPTYTFSSINLDEGVSKWLNEEQQARFTESELVELDALLMHNALPSEVESRSVVEVPADSEDGLAAAIAEAGEGGMVVLKAGNHFESSTVNITQRVTIRGEKGAVLISDVKPLSQVGFVQAALHIQDANNVVIFGLTIQPATAPGGTGILIQNARRSFVVRNTMNDLQLGVFVEQGDQTRIARNTFNTSPAWATGELVTAAGVVISNGDQVRIVGNTANTGFFGVFSSSESGLFLGNNMSGNAIGHILCKVPTAYPLPDGSVVGSQTSATNWLSLYNESSQNAAIGYLVIDGATDNYMAGNEAESNGIYDIELAGASERFGFPTPPCENNKVLVGEGQSIKDCGDNNEVIGGVPVDLNASPCN
ncbi:MAG: right-handed parallel beta-helix repeat-containing protein [Bacteroidota bacterium]